MKLNDDIFAVKLIELEQQYAKLLAHLRACSSSDKETVRREIERIAGEHREAELLLRQRVESSRSPAVSKLAKIQLTCTQEMERLTQGQMAKDMHSEMNRDGEDEAEANLLYAEYAVDFATEAARHALMASLIALYKQMELEEKLAENGEKNPQTKSGMPKGGDK